MKTEQKQQQQRDEYLSLVKSVFPNCLWRFIEDDVYCGFEVAPEPGVLLVFRFGINNPRRVRIEAVYSYSGNYNHKHIMIINGIVPADTDSDDCDSFVDYNCVPDFDFLKKILRNYKIFSS
jgi:hypothetical protein